MAEDLEAEKEPLLIFTAGIPTFSHQLDALREFVELIDSFLSERFKKAADQDRQLLAPLLFVFSKRLPQPHEDIVKQAASDEEVRAGLFSEAGGTVEFDASDKPVFHVQDKQRFKQTTAVALARFGRALHHKRMLYQSALISLTSGIEHFISQLLHAVFEQHPLMIGSKEKTFSLADLVKIGSIDEARKMLVDNAVETILRGSVEDWLKFFKEHVKLTLASINTDTVTEIFQRRNVVVHNGGIANGIYLAKVPAQFRKGVAAGQELRIDPAYLADAIDACELAFLQLAVELWGKLDPKSDERFDIIHNIAFEHIKLSRWSLGAGICKFLMADKRLSERQHMLAQINFWQCQKWSGNYTAIKQEVDAADFSAKDELFRLVLHAIKDEDDAFFDLLPGVLAAEKLTHDDLSTWPIFRKLRSDERFLAYLRVPQQ